MKTTRFLLILGVCILVRLFMITHDETFSRDGVNFIRFAQQWPAHPAAVIKGNKYHAGYPVLMTAAHRALGLLGMPDGPARWERAGYCISLSAALLAMVALWRLALLAFDARVAWVAVLLFGLGRKWASLGADVLSDSLAIALQLWACVLALQALTRLEQRRWASLVSAAAVGLLAGAGYLVRPEALAPVLLAAGLWFLYAATRRVPWPHTLASSGLALLTAAACAMPYALTIGGFTRKKGIDDFLLASPAGPLLAAALPDKVPLLKFAERLFHALHPVLGVGVCLFLAAWVLLRFARGPRLDALRLLLPRAARAPVLLMLLAAAFFAVLLTAMYSHVHYLSHRHVMFLAALLAPVGGAGFLFLARLPMLLLQRVRPWRGLKRLPALLVVIAAAAIAVNTCESLDDDGPAVRAAAAALAAQAEPADVILTDDPRVPFYADIGTDLAAERPRLTELSVAQLEACIPTTRFLVLSRRLYGPPGGPMARRLAQPPFRRLWPADDTRVPRPDAIHLFRVDPPPASLPAPPRPATMPRT